MSRRVGKHEPPRRAFSFASVLITIAAVGVLVFLVYVTAQNGRGK